MLIRADDPKSKCRFLNNVAIQRPVLRVEAVAAVAAIAILGTADLHRNAVVTIRTPPRKVSDMVPECLLAVVVTKVTIRRIDLHRRLGLRRLTTTPMLGVRGAAPHAGGVEVVLVGVFRIDRAIAEVPEMLDEVTTGSNRAIGKKPSILMASKNLTPDMINVIAIPVSNVR